MGYYTGCIVRVPNVVHSTRTYLPMKMEQCSATSGYKIQKHRKESM